MLKNNLNAAAANIPPLLTLCYQTAYVICMQLYMLEHTVLVTAPSYGYNLVFFFLIYPLLLDSTLT
jgi:hypothetical protein